MPRGTVVVLSRGVFDDSPRRSKPSRRTPSPRRCYAVPMAGKRSSVSVEVKGVQTKALLRNVSLLTEQG